MYYIMSNFVLEFSCFRVLNSLDFFNLFDYQSQSVTNLEQNCTSSIVGIRFCRPYEAELSRLFSLF